MAISRSSIGYKFKLCIFVSVIKLLVASDSDELETFTSDGNDELKDGLSGHVQIKKCDVPNEILPCLTHTDSSSTNDCPFKHSKWNNIHCMNDSFGMYTAGERFVNFGVGPFGVNFHNMLYNPLNPNNNNPCGSGDPDEEALRIEALVKENAEAKMNVTLLKQMLEELRDEKEKLEHGLGEMKKTNKAQREEIIILRVRAERWEEGHNKCTDKIKGQNNQSSIPLRVAQNHIAQLRRDNKMYMETIKKYSLDHATLQETLNDVRNQSHHREIELAHCTVSLTECRESEASIQKRLTEEYKEHDTYAHKCEEDYKRLSSEKQGAEVAEAACKASMEAATNVHKEIRDGRDKCLESLGQANVHVDFCTKALRLCRGNHSIAANAGEMCEQDRKTCVESTSQLKGNLMKCEKDKDIAENELISARRNEKTLTEQAVSFQTRLADAKHANNEHLTVIKTLTVNLNNERNAHDDTKARVRTCKVDLVTVETSRDMYRDKAGETLQQLRELRQRHTNVTKGKFHLEAEMAMQKEKYMFIKNNFMKCQEKLNSESQASQKLISVERQCQEHLSNVSTSLSIIELQRNMCLKQHNTKVQQTDEWRGRYEDVQKQLTANRLKGTECAGKLNLLTHQYKSLEEEVDEMHILNDDLSGRLNASVHSLSTMANSFTEIQRTISAHVEEKATLETRLTKCEIALAAKGNRYNSCARKYNESMVLVATLERNTTDIVDALAEMKKDYNQVNQQMAQTQKKLEKQSAQHAKTQQQVGHLQSVVNLTQNLYHGQMAETETVQRQLTQCTNNRTESVSQSAAWRQQLQLCQKDSKKDKLDCFDGMNQMQKRYDNSQTELQSVKETLNVANVAQQQCQHEKKAAEKQTKDVSREYQICLKRHQLNLRRLNTLRRLNQNLQHEIGTWRLRSSNCKRLHGHTTDNLERCRELNEVQEIDIQTVSEQLEDCHRTCRTHQQPACPQAEGETYMPLPSGCLMLSHHKGTQAEMVAFCHEAGGRLLGLAEARTSALQDDLTHLLETIGEHPTAVWATQSEISTIICFAVDLRRLKGSEGVAAAPRPWGCHDQLAGVCLAQHSSHDMNVTYSMVTTNSSEETSQTWSSSNQGSWNHTVGNADINQLLSRFNESSIEDL